MKRIIPKRICSKQKTAHSDSNKNVYYSAPGRNFVLVVPKRLAAAGISLAGDTTSTKEKLYVSVPSRLCSHPLLPENPSATTQQFLKPRLVNVFATIFAESQ